MIKVGLIGIGGMGFTHYNAYKNIPSAKVVAVADVRVDMAKEKTAGDEVNIYSSLEELLAGERVDMIDICTPSYLHTAMSETALLAGCHVLCEKPMSISSEDTTRVIKAAEKSGKSFMVAHVVRFMNNYKYLRSVIESGELGGVVHIDMQRLSHVPLWSWDNWMRDVERRGGTPIDLSIHDIDFAYSVFGEPKSVNGIYKKLENNNDYIVSNLIYDGFSVTATGAWYNAEIPFNANYYAIFERGSVRLTGGKVYKNGELVNLEVAAESVSQNTGINISDVDGYAGEISYFIDCIEKGIKPSAVTPESSAGSVRLVERIVAATMKV